MSSGQLNENSNTQGINDEFQIDLSSTTDLGPGYSYYAWLLPDTVQTEAPPILLGKLLVEQGRVHFLYTGGKSHLNLLSVTSHFLITREVSSVLPTVPSPDTSLWSYYAEIPQAASPTDTSISACSVIFAISSWSHQSFKRVDCTEDWSSGSYKPRNKC